MSNYPTLEELLENQFFSNAIGSISKDSHSRKQYLKFSASTKESLAKHKSDFESRLLEDHKKVIIYNKTYNLKYILVSELLTTMVSRIPNFQPNRKITVCFKKQQNNLID